METPLACPSPKLLLTPAPPPPLLACFPLPPSFSLGWARGLRCGRGYRLWAGPAHHSGSVSYMRGGPGVLCAAPACRHHPHSSHLPHFLVNESSESALGAVAMSRDPCLPPSLFPPPQSTRGRRDGASCFQEWHGVRAGRKPSLALWSCRTVSAPNLLIWLQ